MTDPLTLINHLGTKTIPGGAWAANLANRNRVDVLGLRRLDHATTVSGIHSLLAKIA